MKFGLPILLMLVYPADVVLADFNDKFLVATEYLDYNHPALERVITQLTAGDPRETAVRIHDFVRDEIRFGWTKKFYAMTASEVLKARVGYCNTKSTLFVALLRGAGIPARQHFVQIDARILEPFVRVPQDYVDHSYVKIFLDGQWLAVDSFIPDRKMYIRALAKLRASDRRVGYGVHIAGVNTWDGYSDAFSQYVRSDSMIGRQDYGIFEDTQAFYAKERRSESLRGLSRMLIPLGIGRADGALMRFVR